MNVCDVYHYGNNKKSNKIRKIKFFFLKKNLNLFSVRKIVGHQIHENLHMKIWIAL